jgi:hypothetical protein
VQKAIPYLIKPEEIVPGIPNYYTSNYNGLGVLVKTREGRPIKIEGNPNDPISNGGTDAQAQAAVLDLYDTARLKNPVVKGVDSNWDAADKLVKASLAEIAAKGGNIRILTDTILSPSTKSVIADFSSKYANVKQVIFDATSYSGIINANKNSFEKAGIPSYKFDKAAVVVSFDADFLGASISISSSSKPPSYSSSSSSSSSPCRLCKAIAGSEINLDLPLCEIDDPPFPFPPPPPPPSVVVVISDPEAANSNKRDSAASKLALSSSSDSMLSFRSFSDTEEAFVEDRNACVTMAIVASTSDG